MANELEQTAVLKKAQAWLDGRIMTRDEKSRVKYLMEKRYEGARRGFYKDLEFGTGGLRGIMGVGTNRMNVYTVGAAARTPNSLKRTFAGEQVRVAVAHDSLQQFADVRRARSRISPRTASGFTRCCVRHPSWFSAS